VDQRIKLTTVEHSNLTSIANRSNSRVNRVCFSAHGTATVCVPCSAHLTRGTRDRPELKHVRKIVAKFNRQARERATENLVCLEVMKT